MGLLALLSGVLSFLLVFFSFKLALILAGLSCLSGLISAINTHYKQLNKLTESFVAKVGVAAVGLITLIVSEPIARLIIGRLTWLDPSIFPQAVTLSSYIITALVLAALLFLLVFISSGILIEGPTSRCDGKLLLAIPHEYDTLSVALDKFWPP